MKHLRWIVIGVVFGTLMALVGVAESASLSQALQGGDSLTVTCNGQRLDQRQDNSRQRTLTCVPNPTTTTTTTRPATTTTSTSTTTSTTTSTSTTTTLPTGGGFLEAFTGAPSTPTPWAKANWDVTVHSRDDTSRYVLPAMDAMHGPQCQAPPATHPISAYQDVVYQCNDHVMTAINGAAGYGAAYLTPNQQIDFSQPATLKFDMSTMRTTSRDWIDFWITPFAENLQTPLEAFYPDFNGPPRDAIHIFMTTFSSKTGFRAEIYRNFVSTELPTSYWDSYENHFTPDAARRDTFQLTINGSKLTFGMPAYNLWWMNNVDDGGLNWSRGVVTFGHHSYTPDKDCSTSGLPMPGMPSHIMCGPNTWHWDNVSINPAVPFTLIRADRRFVDPTSPGAINFAAPAPAGAYLRFSGLGTNLQFSVNGGATWITATQQAQYKANPEEHAASYWTPIPQGAQSVMFRGTNCWCGQWAARDLTIWAP